MEQYFQGCISGRQLHYATGVYNADHRLGGVHAHSLVRGGCVSRGVWCTPEMVLPLHSKSNIS